MASFSSLPPSVPSSSLSRTSEYDVFLSFHGKDVRRNVLSHILNEFKRKSINTFIDKEVKRGKYIGPELKKAIQGSRIKIVLLSKRFASSSWCLDELVEILKCKTEFGQTVITVFYEVNTTAVKKLTGAFGKAFKETCEGKSTVTTKKWSQALVEVATIAGYHSREWVDDSAMIENMAANILNMLFNSTPSRDFDCLIGMGAHMRKLEPYLRLDLEEVRMIGIWGPPGIGKTTIARFLFSQLSNGYQLSAFMESLRGKYTIPACSDDYDAKLYLQQVFVSKIISQKDVQIPHLGAVQDRLKDKKVLVVLDDVNHSVQLDAMAEKNQWFGPQSRIIITTQDRRLLRAHGITHIYKVDYPIDEEAFQMFCMYAFKQKFPYDGFEELSREVTRLSGNLPLGLKVMGSYFRGMSKQEWIMNLPRLRSELNGRIENILKFSYDALFDEDKDLFLHIACLFNHKEMKKVEEYLAESFRDVRQGIEFLAGKSLISINVYGYIEIHSLLAQMGVEIVRKQSVENRQFLVDARDIRQVLNDDTTVARRVIGINYVTDGKALDFNERTLKGMSNLQFLRLAFESGCLNYISPKLRLLEWQYSPVTCFPSTFALDCLVELSIPYSKLEKLWEGNKPLPNLKWMNLEFSSNLKEPPDLSTATRLEKLDLQGCSSLLKLPCSIGNATSLQILNLEGCYSLVMLPFSIGNATSLQILNLQGCSSLVELPFSIGNATSLKEVCLEECSSLVELPYTIGNLHKLSKLNLKGCSKLEALPTNINLESLIKLDLRDCSMLKTFPEISTNIKHLDLVGTAIKEAPLSIKSWSSLEELHMPYSEDLKESPHALDSSITELHLTDTEIQELGPWVKGCSPSPLRRLVLNGMQKLVSLSELPDSLLDLAAANCESLERLDCSFCNPDFRLHFRNCFKLSQEGRDLIIQSYTRDYVVLPGVQVPDYFTNRAFGSSVTVKLNQKPLRTSTQFKACILVRYQGGSGRMTLHCDISFRQNACTIHSSDICFISPTSALSDHLYIFGVEAEEITSGKIDVDFKPRIGLYGAITSWEIIECGVLPTSELHVGGDNYEASDIKDLPLREGISSKRV